MSQKGEICGDGDGDDDDEWIEMTKNKKKRNKNVKNTKNKKKIKKNDVDNHIKENKINKMNINNVYVVSNIYKNGSMLKDDSEVSKAEGIVVGVNDNHKDIRFIIDNISKDNMKNATIDVQSKCDEKYGADDTVRGSLDIARKKVGRVKININNKRRRANREKIQYKVGDLINYDEMNWMIIYKINGWLKIRLDNISKYIRTKDVSSRMHEDDKKIKTTYHKVVVKGLDIIDFMNDVDKLEWVEFITHNWMDENKLDREELRAISLGEGKKKKVSMLMKDNMFTCISNKGNIMGSSNVHSKLYASVFLFNATGLSSVLQQAMLINVCEKDNSIGMIVVTESWMNQGQLEAAKGNWKSRGYSVYGKCRGSNKQGLDKGRKKGKQSGGVVIWVNDKIIGSCREIVEDGLSGEGCMWVDCSIDNIQYYIFACYMPPEGSIYKNECECIWKIMEVGYERLKERGRIIMMGDFNARTGSMSSSVSISRVSNDKIIDSRGKELVKFCQRNGLVILNGSVKDSGFFTNRDASVVDYIIVDEEWASEVRGMKVIGEGKNIVKQNLQHEVIEVEMSWGGKVRKKIEKLKGLKRAKCLFNRLVPAKFIQEIMDRVMVDQNVEIQGAANVEVAWGIFKSRVERAVIELKKVKIRKSEVWVELDSGINIVERKLKNLPIKSALWKSLSRARRALKRKRRFAWEKDILMKNVEDGNEWVFLERYAVNRKRSQVRNFGNEGIINKEGEIVYGNGIREVAKRAWMELGSESGGVKSVSGGSDYEKELMKVEKDMNSQGIEVKDDELSRVFEEEEIVEVLKGRSLKRKKASDNLGFISDLFRNGLKNTVKAMLCLFRRVFLEGCPKDWKLGIIIPIYKGTGSRKDVDNYRGICILNVMNKIYCKVLYNRLMKWCEGNNIIMDEQGGFRPHRGCRDQLYALHEILSVRAQKGQNTYCCFVDFRKAYDNVWRRDMMVSLWKAGVKGNMFNAIKMLYEEVYSCVCIDGFLSDSFGYDVGVRQGCILSPLLFSIYFNMIATSLNNKFPKLGVHLYIPKCSLKDNIGLDEYYLKNLWYADDLALMVETGEDLQVLLDELDLLTDKHKSYVNENKTKVVVFGNKEWEEDGVDMKWYIGDKVIERVSEYRYLGIWFDESLLFRKSIKERMCKIYGVIEELKRLGKNRVVGIKMILQVFYAKFISIMEYGCIIWSVAMKKNDWVSLEINLRNALRAMLNIHKHEVHNVVIHGDLGIPSFEGIVRKRRIVWWRVLEEMHDSRVCKLIYRWARLNSSKWWESMTVTQHSINPQRKDWKTADWIEGWRAYEEENWLNDVLLKTSEDTRLKTYRKLKSDLKIESYLCVENERHNSSIKKKLLLLRQGKTDMHNWNKRAGEVAEVQVMRYCCYCVRKSENSVLHVLGICPRWEAFRIKVWTVFQGIIDSVGGVEYLHSFDEEMVNWSVEKVLVWTMLGSGVFEDLEDAEMKLWLSAVEEFLQKVASGMVKDDLERKQRIALLSLLGN